MSSQPRDPGGIVPLRWFKYLPAPMFILDRKGKLSYCNDAFVEMTGYRREEILGATLDTLVGQEDLKQTLKDILTIYEGRGMARAQYDLLRKSGSRIHVSLNITPVYGEGEEGAIVISAIGLVMEARELG